MNISKQNCKKSGLISKRGVLTAQPPPGGAVLKTFYRLSNCLLATLSLAVLCIFSNCSCQLPFDSSDNTSVSVLNYNVQTLFDDELAGTEFPEYIPSDSGWNTVKYHRRLENLSRVIRESCNGGADIVVLQEVENLSVVEELNRYFLRGMGYRYAAGAFMPGQAFGQVVLSRFRLEDVISISAAGEFSMRPALELTVHIDGQHSLKLFAVHLKSKRGEDPVETEDARLIQAHSISRRVEQLVGQGSLPVLICGDFNENYDEFSRIASRAYRTALVSETDFESWNSLSADAELQPLVIGGSTDTGLPQFQSFWQSADNMKGSYAFRDSWETIDNMLFLSSSDMAVGDCRVINHAYLLNSAGEPKAYRASGGYGYSDHLPLLMEIQLN